MASAPLAMVSLFRAHLTVHSARATAVTLCMHRKLGNVHAVRCRVGRGGNAMVISQDVGTCASLLVRVPPALVRSLVLCLAT